MSGRETITANELKLILGIKAKTSILRRAEKEGWKYHQGPNKVKHYYIDSLPPEIQERVIRYHYGVDEESVEEMARRFEIRVPPEKLQDPQLAMKIRNTDLAIQGRLFWEP